MVEFLWSDRKVLSFLRKSENRLCYKILRIIFFGENQILMSLYLRTTPFNTHRTRRRFAMTNSANLQAKHRQPNVRCNVNSNDAFCLPDPFLESFFLTHLDGEAEKNNWNEISILANTCE